MIVEPHINREMQRCIARIISELLDGFGETDSERIIEHISKGIGKINGIEPAETAFRKFFEYEKV